MHENMTEGRRLLLVYLKANDRTAAWLARKCDIDSVTAWRWVKGKRDPTTEQRIIIESVTGIPAQLWGS